MSRARRAANGERSGAVAVNSSYCSASIPAVERR